MKLGDEKHLPCYKLEWRASGDSPWLPAPGHAECHDSALAKMENFSAKHGGQVRVIVQHVIESTPLTKVVK